MNNTDCIHERDRLLQKNLPTSLIPNNPLEYVTVYELGDPPNDITIFCALIPHSMVEKALTRDEWDLHFGYGRPYFEHDDTRVISYQRISDHEGVEPLVHDRDYHNHWRSAPEVSEEFRLFHNLYQALNGELWKLNHNSEEVLVGKVEARKVTIQLDLLRQYLAVRRMHLAVYYASHQRSDVSMSDLGFEDEYRDSGHNEKSRFRLVVTSGWDTATFSRKTGKILVPPYPQDHDSIRYFYDGPPKTYEEFIIGVDDQGREVRFTCDKDRLGNYFGANPNAPNYMTKILFRSTVLQRYYAEPSRFSVEDGLVRCQGLWVHRMDNHGPNGVWCALGDLGDLPPQEQAHWKSHNIAPVGDWSETTKSRWFDAEFTDSERPEDLFLSAYAKLSQVSTTSLGWPIVRPLHVDDQHHLANVHIPTGNEQTEFDGIIASLVMVVIESLNSRMLKGLLPETHIKQLESENPDTLKNSISVLENVLRYHHVTGAEVHIQTLKNLQAYRSTAIAHRRGKDWKRVINRLSPDGRSLRDVATSLIRDVTSALNFLSVWVETLDPSDAPGKTV